VRALAFCRLASPVPPLGSQLQVLCSEHVSSDCRFESTLCQVQVLSIVLGILVHRSEWEFGSHSLASSHMAPAIGNAVLSFALSLYRSITYITLSHLHARSSPAFHSYSKGTMSTGAKGKRQSTSCLSK
jgi:hypothetical protein